MDNNNPAQPTAPGVNNDAQPTVSDELPVFPETATPDSMAAETPPEPAQPLEPAEILAEPEPEEYHERAVKRERRWPLTAAIAVGAIGLAVGLVFGVRTIYRTINEPEPQKITLTNTQEQGQAPKPPETNTAGGSNPSNQAGGSTSPSSSGGTSPASPAPASPTPSTGGAGSTPSPSQNTTANRLPESGTGDVAAIFVITAGAAAGLHYIFSARKTARR